jgi:hypothetical protein
MDDLIGFTKDDLFYSRDSFIDAYNLSHPDAGPYIAKSLDRTLGRIFYEYIVVVDGYKEHIRLGFKDPFLENQKIFWLLCGIRFTDFSAQFQSFIIEKNDPFLSEEDCVLMFYISLQDAEIQDAAHDLPLSMVYDMFMPVAAENLKQWKLET